jgi:AGCS family alanine or glycine:cation symporter
MDSVCLIEFVERAHALVWGPWMLILIISIGLAVHFILGLDLFRQLVPSFKLLLRSRQETASGQVSPFKALVTTLAATIGTGSIAGVATAISTGGPGALFWMWVAGVVGMATKFAEAALALEYRVIDSRGEYLGGPMFYISRGLGSKFVWMGTLYAALAAFTAFGLGNIVQANAVAQILSGTFQIPHWITGFMLSALVAAVILGGLNRVAKIAEAVVPVMALAYVGASLTYLVIHFKELPAVFSSIFYYAWAPAPAMGGFLGASVASAMRMGIARGIFANEAGLGSGAISHAAAKTSIPVNQGFVAMWGTIIDTLIICNMSGLILLTSGQWNCGLSGASLTAAAFNTTFSFGCELVAVCLLLFSFTTILGWGFYGERCFEYLFGESSVRLYRWLWICALPLGATVQMTIVWLGSDIMNALMAVPNLIALFLLLPKLKQLYKAKKT